MNFNEVYKVLEQNRYYVFSYDDAISFFPKKKRNNLKQLIYRWKEKGWIVSLKRGLYELTYPKEFNIPDLHVAHKLYSPSYISLETALSHYSIIPEVSMAVTSITTKPTRKFKNKHGLFIYHTVQPAAFAGYYIEKQGGFDIFMAEPEKALIDYLYFMALRDKKFSLSEARLDRKVISKLKGKKLKRYAQLYHFSLKGLYAYL